jgi:hypothetical protein
MREIPLKRIPLAAQRGMRRDFRGMMQRTGDQVRGALARHATGFNGTIPERNIVSARREAREAMLRTFVSVNDAPFGDDGVTAISPFAAMLNKWYVRVIAATVYAHRDWMAANLPDDVYRWLRTVPSRRVTRVAEQTEGVERLIANPWEAIDTTRQWVPMHAWTGPDGYRLSDRIWQVGQEARATIDRILAQRLSQNWSAERIARELTRYLTPSEAGIITRTPYGRPVVYSAMRLARTEISRAANQASYISGYLNPYVSGMDVARSQNGDPTCKICPDHASIDLNGERVRDPYPFDECPIPPFHPHDRCHVRPVVEENPTEATERIRQMMNEVGEMPSVTPAQPEALLLELLGMALFGYLMQQEGVG